MTVADVGLSAEARHDLWERPLFGVTLTRDPHLAQVGERRALWRHVSVRELDADWDPTEARRTVDLRFPDGKLFLAVDHDESLGYLIHAPRFGRHRVAPDGRTITSALPRIAPWRWERLFLAQVVPLAAVLQGLEIFHASAVALHGHVVAFVGASGAGKTSTAAHLVARGFDFVTDDVLALEARQGSVLAHPGAARLGIDAREVRRMAPAARPRLGEFLGAFEKRQFAPPPVQRPLPMRLMYFLQRRPELEPAAIVEVHEPRRLLGAPFIPHVQSRERLTRHLDICARLARTVRTFVIRIPTDCNADDVAARVHEHASAALARTPA